MRYATKVCGGVDILAVTHLDAVTRAAAAGIPLRSARRYPGVGDLLPLGPWKDLTHQQHLTDVLSALTPDTVELPTHPADVAAHLASLVGAPVVLTSDGPVGPLVASESLLSHDHRMEQSSVSVDVVALRFGNPEPGSLRYGVAPRRWEPYTGQTALPGILLGAGERLETAARRAVTTKLGIPDDAILAVGQLEVFDEPSRDPRGPTLSIAMWAVITADNITTDPARRDAVARLRRTRQPRLRPRPHRRGRTPHPRHQPPLAGRNIHPGPPRHRISRHPRSHGHHCPHRQPARSRQSQSHSQGDTWTRTYRRARPRAGHRPTGSRLALDHNIIDTLTDAVPRAHRAGLPSLTSVTDASIDVANESGRSCSGSGLGFDTSYPVTGYCSVSRSIFAACGDARL